MENKQSITKESYNLIAEDWHKDHQHDDWWKSGTDHFISLLAPGSTVLDLGCGAGTKTKYLLKHGLKVVGADFSEKMIDIARREVAGAQFFVCDLHDIASLPQKFDAVFMQAVLLHIPKDDAQNVISIASAQLNAGGHLYVAVKETKQDRPTEEMVHENDYGYSYDRFFSYFTRDEIEHFFTAAGLKVVFSEVQNAGKTNWVQVIGVK